MNEMFQIRDRIFQPGRTYVMGILNVTPDSFSDGGSYRERDAALAQAEAMIHAGVDVIDIGGESTRPGFTPVSADEEMERVLPILEEIHAHFPVLISLDTTKPEVAEAALPLGVDLINDIWGGKREPSLLRLSSEFHVSVCLMHNQEGTSYTDLMGQVTQSLLESARMAEEAGISSGKILLDPGIGFGKTVEQNLKVLAHLAELTALPYPILVGASRKSVIGKTLDLPVDQREEGTLAVTALAEQAGVRMVRVHDVEKNVRLLRMLQAVREAG